ncbi:hypothetical protein EIP91_010136 [Steccherinum ochraceum]|uniref:AB hydrolase-1 domain-containing protein n=1 Tax=Steccherinum ochraceum TaxID=92696 RepID=A0A4R0RRA9_9APHY|nr:hypothetical protein EIP91_010136 [Steccherinum ochraceum]
MLLFATATCVLLVSAATSQEIRSAPPSFTRIPLSIPVHVTANATVIDYDTPRNQTQLTGLVQDTFSVNSSVSSLQVGSAEITRSYLIFGELYVPLNWENRGSGVLEFAVHGLNLDRFYWSIGGQGSQFNYVESSIASGNAVFVFDRLGSGNSSKPDGIKEVQTAIHVAVMQSLVTFFRHGVHGFAFNFLLASLAANHANILDALILTGFTTDTRAVAVVNAGLGLTIASIANPSKFGTLSNSYLATASGVNLQQDFLHFPDFPQSSLDFIVQHKGVITIGELLTRGQALSKTAAAYTGPVLVVTGDKDMVECGGDCHQSSNGSANLLEPAHSFFPSVSVFETFIPCDP